jgi:hypothetical protein
VSARALREGFVEGAAGIGGYDYERRWSESGVPAQRGAQDYAESAVELHLLGEVSGQWRRPSVVFLEPVPAANCLYALNDESYATCKADMLIKGQDVANIIVGNTLSDDGHGGRKFDYMLSNPPFGVEWKKVEKAVRKEHEEKGFDGRFGPGLPRVSDGSMLFLMHLLSKMRPAQDGGSRFGIVLNGSTFCAQTKNWNQRTSKTFPAISKS